MKAATAVVAAYVVAISGLAVSSLGFGQASASTVLDGEDGLSETVDEPFDPVAIEDQLLTEADGIGHDTMNHENMDHGGGDAEHRVAEQAAVEAIQVLPASFQQAGNACQAGSADVAFDIVAINIDTPLNRHGDFDPEGRMFVLEENLAEVEAALDEYAAQRAAGDPVNVSAGLADDVIQPLTIRANLGQCVQLNLTNQLDDPDERASIHLHRAGVTPEQGGTNVGDNRDSFGDQTVGQGESTSYTFEIPDDEVLEGSFYFHSHGDTRFQTAHGLFGALIAQPAGAEYLHPETREPIDSGWEAIISQPDGTEFREWAKFYHEVGNEDFKLRDSAGRQVEQFEQFTNTYRPGARALNYRSEPFLRRMQDLRNTKPLAYSSYTFGDPVTPMPRSFVGDPAKTRLIHGGAETFHSHHLHGGSIRWPFQPEAEETRMFNGLDKIPDVQLRDSELLDVQNIGPGETYTLEHECGSGGCQQGAGEFLYHCHFINHYPAGMWGFWRVFDTQEGSARLNAEGETVLLGTLANNADVPEGKNSLELRGDLPIEILDEDGNVTLTIIEGDASGDPSTVNVDDYIRSQLPIQGERFDRDDANVWDWVEEGGLYLAEPEGEIFVNYPGHPRGFGEGERPEILFNETNGRVAFPMLSPHLGERPPWAPNRDGAPYLRHLIDPVTGEVDANRHPSQSGDTQIPESLTATTGADAIAPTGATIRTAPMVAIDLEVLRNTFEDEGAPIDQPFAAPGEIWVRAQDAQDVLNGDLPSHQAALRANASLPDPDDPQPGDVVEFTIMNALTEVRDERVNFHGHFMQFDTQASDGVISGLSFEQSSRSYYLEDRWLTESAQAGDNSVTVTNADGLREGIWIGVGVGTEKVEVQRIQDIIENGDGTFTLTFHDELANDHDENGGLTQPGTPLQGRNSVSTEFNRQTWYMDAEVGTIYFHDHVDGVRTWPRGLFGAVIIGPHGAEYSDPQTGATYGPNEVPNAPIADVDCSNCVRSVTDEDGGAIVLRGDEGEVDSYRDFAFFITENDPATGTSYNLRAEPLEANVNFNLVPGRETGNRPDVTQQFNSAVFGDPETPLLEAYEDDPVRIRLLHGGPGHTGAHAWRLTGHQFSTERFGFAGDVEGRRDVGTSTVFDTLTIANAERFDPMLDGGAGAPGDYMYYNAQAQHLEDGSWGIFRVLDRDDSGATLPALPVSGPGNQPGDGAPAPGGPDVEVDVTAVALPAEHPLGAAFVPSDQADDVASGAVAPEPLVIRASAGDTIEVTLTNELDHAVSLNPGGVVSADPADSQGITLGNNGEQHVDPGDDVTYTWVARSEDHQLGAAVMADMANAPNGMRAGLYGAIVVAPEGSTHHDRDTGEVVNTGWEVEVRNGDDVYQDFALLFHESDDFFGNAQPLMPYREDVRGFTGINYARGESNPDPSQAFEGTPAVTLDVEVGDAVRIHGMTGAGEANGVFSIDGLNWAYDPNVENSSRLGARAFTPGQVISAHLDGENGSALDAPGDYLVLNHRLPYAEAGQWAVLSVSGDAAAAAGGNGGVAGLTGVPQGV